MDVQQQIKVVGYVLTLTEEEAKEFFDLWEYPGWGNVPELRNRFKLVFGEFFQEIYRVYNGG